MLLGFISLTDDWLDRSTNLDYLPFFNVQLLSSLIFIAAFAFINQVNFNQKYTLKPKNLHSYRRLFNFTIPGMLIFALYGALLLEVMAYFDQQYLQSFVEIKVNQLGDVSSYYDSDIPKFKGIWMMNYTLFFISILCFINALKIRNPGLKLVNLVAALLVLIVFLNGVLIVLGALRDSYMQQYLSEYYQRGIMHLGIRYVAIGFLALLLFAVWKQMSSPPGNERLKVTFHIALHLTVIWILSSELFHWMDISGVKNTYKLGLSILWGVYALFMVVLGIWKGKKYLRVVGMLLFAITLCKLFIYDIARLGTIKKNHRFCFTRHPVVDYFLSLP